MRYREHPPHPCLQKYIKCYWTLDISGSTTLSEELQFLVEGLEFSFNLSDTTYGVTRNAETGMVPRFCVYGPMTHTMRIRPVRQMEIFGICFRPGGAYPFFSLPVSGLINGCVEMYDLWESKSSEIINRVGYGCETLEERIALLDRYFLQQLDNVKKKDCRISVAVDAIAEYEGKVNIDYLAGLIGLSGRQLERKFRQQVGMSPKQLCRNFRFKNVLKHVGKSPVVSWAAIAAACGYYDQSHMIKDFKHFTDKSPAAYFIAPSSLESYFTGNF